MTKADDVRELIAEQSSGPEERRAMNAVAGALEESLSREVPYRPEFKAELRRRVMAQARRELTPWYRKPAVWGSSVAAVAAVAVLAVGLQLYTKTPNQPGPVATEQPTAPTPTTTTPGGITSKLVGYMPLPVLDLNPEVLPQGAPGPESLAGVDPTNGLTVYEESVAVDSAQFERIARGLGFTGQARAAGKGFALTQANRSLELTADGHVMFKDTATDAAGAQPVDVAGAQAAARRFLEQASLPVPSLEPVTMEGQVGGKKVYAVTYTPRVAGRPVVNGRTVVQVNDRGRVTQADGYVQAAQSVHGTYTVILPDEAKKQAGAKNDAAYDGVDLVYVRTPDGGAVFLQPYWRVYGTTAQGARMVRYVPALAKEK